MYGLNAIKMLNIVLNAKLAAPHIAIMLFLSGCGAFEANIHPDQLLEDSRGLATIGDVNSFINLRRKNPLFRKAKVTTRVGSLKVKTQPSSFAKEPRHGPRELTKNQAIDIYWPTEIQNNHIKVLVNNQAAWVTHRSQQGHLYVTLLEDMELPKVQLPDFQVQKQPSTSPTIQTLPGAFSLPNLPTVILPHAAITEAHESIDAVSLPSSDIRSCQFNPLIGNSHSSNNCYERIVLSSNFKDFLKNHGHSCAMAAAQETFGQSPRKILFHSSYAGQVRRNRRVSGSGKKSTHSTGQALDLFAISVYLTPTQPRRVTLHKNQTDGSSVKEKENHQFYWSFARCWREKVKTHSPCPCSTSKSGAMTYLENSAHHNHIHVSIPHCERRKYNVSCV